MRTREFRTFFSSFAVRFFFTIFKKLSKMSLELRVLISMEGAVGISPKKSSPSLFKNVERFEEHKIFLKRERNQKR